MDRVLCDILESLWVDLEDLRLAGAEQCDTMKDALVHLTCAIENIKKSEMPRLDASLTRPLPIESCKRLVEFRWSCNPCGSAFFKTHDREWQDLIRAEHAPEKTESSTPRRLVTPTEQKDKCAGCKANVDLSSGWTGRWFVSTGAPNVKYIKPGLWCQKCAGPLSSPGRCTALPSSSCPRDNETIIVNLTTCEERFSCGRCATSPDVRARGFVVKIGCDV